MYIDKNATLRVDPEKYYNDAYDMVNLFYKGKISRGAAEAAGENFAPEVSRENFAPEAASEGADIITIKMTNGLISIRIGGFAGFISDTGTGDGPARAYTLKMALYKLLKTRAREGREAEPAPQWGALVGVRPVKMYAKLLDGGLTGVQAAAEMARLYDVSAGASELCVRIAGAQRAVLRRYDPDRDYMLYAGVPFCTTKCAYCSFPSDAHNKAGLYARHYIGALARELAFCAERMRGAGRRLKALYIGGGTPTALDRDDLEQLIGAIIAAYPGEQPDEWTIEAGRADTIDRDKLTAIKRAANHTANLRLCINPQTMNSKTLELIGRGHTPEDVAAAFKLARSLGFGNINMDVIAGLPGEGLRDFENTLDRVADLNPDSFTSHTLCIKRSSRLNEFYGRYSYPDAECVAAMHEAARRRAGLWGMEPYYLYRQKNTVGGLANVGYARKNGACIYNIHEMADRVDVIAVGAGAVTKLTNNSTGAIERVFNVKNLLEYISRIDEMIERKNVLF